MTTLLIIIIVLLSFIIILNIAYLLTMFIKGGK
jgi:hypothetical protein